MVSRTINKDLGFVPQASEEATVDNPVALECAAAWVFRFEMQAARRLVESESFSLLV